MNKILRQVCIITFAALLLIISGNLAAQTSPSSEADLKKEAAKYFDNEDFTNAYPLYSQLLSLYPDNSDYNYRFGTCMLFSKSDKEKPVNYLELAVKDPNIDKLAYYYLGRAYHLNYRFDDAITAYQHFKQIASSSELKKHPVEHLIEMCNNGKTLLKDVHDLDVLVKKELSLEDYFHAYDLSANGGNTLVEPDDFKTRLDKKKQQNSVVYLSPDKNEVFYASYGDNDKNGKDIYEVKRLPTGGFSKPTNLGDVINTPYDEDYPFYDAPTHTLYFCSKGHNSMGGYDVFKSIYDENTNSWGAPVNMDFPISTPDDDILFIADTLGQTAYFASTRSSPEGMIDIYKIKIQKHAPATVLLKGIAYTDNGKKPAASTITVKNYETGQTVGIYNSSHDDGSYFMSLPNGSQLVYSVETPGHATQSKPVIIPKEEELVTLKQEIGYDTSTDKLIITNHFQAASANADYLLALDYIKKKAQMDVDTNIPPPLAKNDTTRLLQQNNTETTNVANNIQDNHTGLNQNNTTEQRNNTALAQNNSNSTSGNNSKQNNSPINQNNEGTASVNSTNSDSLENNNSTANPSNTSQNNEGTISTGQLVKIADSDALEQQQAAESAKEDADRATQYANDKMDEAQNLNNEALRITDNAVSITDEQQKKDSLAKASTLHQQANDLTKKAIEAYQIAAQEQTDAKTKERQAELAASYSSNLDSVTKTKNNKEAIAQLQAEQDSLKKQQESAPVTQVTASELIRQQAQDTKQDSTEAAHHNDELKQEVSGLQQQSEDYINQAQKTDNAQEKVALLQQAKDLADSKKAKQKEIKDNEKLQQQLHSQYVNQLAQAQSADSISHATALAGASSQPSSEDAASIKEEIKNYNPSNQTTLAGNNSANSNTSSPLSTSNNNTTNSAQNNTTSNAENNNSLASTNTASNSQEADTSNNNPNETNTNTPGNVSSANNNSSSSQNVTSNQNASQNSNENNNATSVVGDTNKNNSSEIASAKQGNVDNTSNATQQTSSNTNNASPVVQFNNTSGISNVIPTTSVQYSDPVASTASKNAVQYNTDADSLSSQADAARLAAHNASDNEQARIYSEKADSLDKASEQKRIQSDETTNAAGNSQFASNKQQLDSWKNTVQNSGSDKLTTANLLAQDAEFYYNKSLIEKQKADSSSKAYIKQNYLDNEKKYLATSILKQQEAKNLYLSINPNLASSQLTASANQVQQNNSSANNTQGNNNSAAELNNTTSINSNTQNPQNGSQSNPLSSSANSTDLATTANPANNNTNQVSPSNNTENNTDSASVGNTTTLGQPENNTEGSNAPTNNNSSLNQSTNNNSVTNNPTTQQGNQNNTANNTTSLGQLGNNSSAENNTNAQPNNSNNSSTVGQPNNNTNNSSLTSNASSQQGNDSNSNNHTTNLGEPTNSIADNNVTANNNSSNANQVSNPANSSTTTSTTNPDSVLSASNSNSSQNTTSANNNSSSSIESNASNQQTLTNNNNVAINNSSNAGGTSNNTNSANSTQVSENNPANNTINNSSENNTTVGNTVNPVNSSLAANNSTIANDSIRKASKIDSILSAGNATNITTNNNASNTTQQTQTSDNGSVQNNNSSSSANNSNPTISNNTLNSNNGQQTESNSGNTANQNNSTATVTNPTTNNANANNNTSNNSELNIASTKANTIDNNTNSSTQSSEANNTPDNLNSSTSDNNTVSAPVTADIFSEVATSPYSETKPIPINPALPQGLIFKVQVGAFRNQIPQNLFKGMQPITGEKTKTGLTRYTAGIFKEFNGAKDAQNKIHGLGFKDAFIVAFLNGKRISISQALAMLGGNTANSTASESQQPANNNAATTQTPENNESGAPSTQVSDVKGLFYSVQIGAFQHPVPAIKLYNLSPLFSYNAPNGYIRYNCGIYSSLTNASNAKQQIVSRTPIKDAFVVAYSDGQRISLTQATQLISNGSAKLPQNSKLDMLPDGSSAGGQSSPQQATQVTTSVQNNTSAQTLETSNNASTNAPVNTVTPGDTNKSATPITNNSITIQPSAPKDTGNTSPAVTVIPTTVTPPPTPIPSTTNESSIVTRTLSSTTVEEAGDVNVSITIHRGNISGFAKLEEIIPNGFTATEGEKQNSTFKFEDGKVKYVWLSLPSDSVFTVTYKLTALSTVSGQQTINGKFFYLENNERQATSIGTSVITVSNTASSNNSSANNLPAVNNTPATKDTTGKKVVFSVQVGAFSGPIPIDMANKLLNISSQGIKTHKEDNGITTYTVGEYSNYTSANLLKEELSKDGYPQSFIVAYYQDKKISLQQAQVLMNK